MAANPQGDERKVSVSINIRAGSIPQSVARELEDRIRDVADDYPGVQVAATQDAERPTLRP